MAKTTSRGKISCLVVLVLKMFAAFASLAALVLPTIVSCKLKTKEGDAHEIASSIEIPLGEYRLQKAKLFSLGHGTPTTLPLAKPLALNFENGTGKVVKLARWPNRPGGFKLELAGIFSLRDASGATVFADCSTGSDVLSFEIYSAENGIGRVSKGQKWDLGCTWQPKEDSKDSAGYLWELDTVDVLAGGGLRLEFLGPPGQRPKKKRLQEVYRLVEGD